MKGLVLYHYPCTDGAYAALAAWLALGDEHCKFVPHSPKELPLNMAALSLVGAETLYLIDYCGPSVAWLMECCTHFHRVVLIDHHKTAFEMIQALPHMPANLVVQLALNRSACVMALEHFAPQRGVSEELRSVFAYIQDNDIWTHALPDSTLFTAGLASFKLDFDFSVTATEPVATRFAALAAVNVAGCVVAGRVEYDRITELIRCYSEEARAMRWGLGVAIAPKDYGCISRLGHELATRSKTGMAAIFCDGRVSLRAIEGVDCTVVAKEYGGGGHAGASGMNMTRTEWDKLF